MDNGHTRQNAPDEGDLPNGLIRTLRNDVVDPMLAASVRLSLQGLSSAGRVTSTLFRPVLDDDTVDAVLRQIAASFRRLLDLPDDGDAGSASDEDDVQQVRRRFQELLARSTDVHPSQGEGALLQMLAQMSPDEALMLRYIAETGHVAAADLLRVSLVGTGPDVVLRCVSLLPERAGAAEPDRGPVYVANLVRLGLIEWVDKAVEDTDDYELIEANPKVLERTHDIRSDRPGRPKLRKGRLVLTVLGQRLTDIGLDGAE